MGWRTGGPLRGCGPAARGDGMAMAGMVALFGLGLDLDLGQASGTPGFWVLLAALALAAFLAWRVSPRFRHFCQLWLGRLTGNAHPRETVDYLAEERVPLEVVLDSGRGTGGRPLGTCLIQAVRQDSLRLEVIQDKGVTPALAGSPVICHFRPLRHLHLKATAFRTFVSAVDQDRAATKILVVGMPAATLDLQRRKEPRVRLSNLRTAMARVWLKTPGLGRDWHLKVSEEAFHVGTVERHDLTRPDERVVDVSPGGLRLMVPKPRVKGAFEYGKEVNVELRVFDPAIKGFEGFFFSGVVRHVTHTRHGQLLIGLEFTQVGVRRGQGDLDFTGSPGAPVLGAFKKVLSRLAGRQH